MWFVCLCMPTYSLHIIKPIPKGIILGCSLFFFSFLLRMKLKYVFIIVALVTLALIGLNLWVMLCTNTSSEGVVLIVASSVLLFISVLYFVHDYVQRKKEKESQEKKNGE